MIGEGACTIDDRYYLSLYTRSIMTQKIKRFIQSLHKNKISAYLVTRPLNITYLTDFSSSDSWLLLVPPKTYYITDARYTTEARQGLAGISVKEWKDSREAMVHQLLEKHQLTSLGFDGNHLTYSGYKKMRRELKGMKLVEKNSLIEHLREIKTALEVSHIRQGLQLHKKSWQYLKKTIKPGLTEREISRKLEAFIRSKGGALSFDTIVASGPNACLPHARVTDRVCRRDDWVLVDWGIDLNGYKTDLTRMFFLGKIPQIILRAYQILRTAQRAAISKIQAGTAVADIDREARNVLAAGRLSRYFTHALGHGVGLDVHESPRVSQRNQSILKEGMIITIEPGVYVPLKYGLRIEDMILVHKEDCEVLSDDIY